MSKQTIKILSYAYSFWTSFFKVRSCKIENLLTVDHKHVFKGDLTATVPDVSNSLQAIFFNPLIPLWAIVYAILPLLCYVQIR